MLSKVFETIVSNELKNKFNSNNCQFGFKDGQSTLLCVLVFSQIENYYINNKSIIYALFLDASKAFDRVHHSRLFKNLKDKGVFPLYIRLVLIMYSLNQCSS